MDEQTHKNGAEALDRAIAACETQAELARRVSDIMGEAVTTQHVWSWKHRASGKVPAEYCRAIEQACRDTADPVTRYELRRDVFGPPPSVPLATVQPDGRAAPEGRARGAA